MNVVEISLVVVILIYFAVFLSIYFGWHKLPEVKSGKIEKPVSVSVIIAARNEPDTLPLLLDDLYKQKYPPDCFDIIIVDDHSQRPLNHMEQINNFPGNNLKLFELPDNMKGKKHALLEGVKRSNSELLLFTDADCRVGEKWIHSFAGFYAEHASEFMMGLVDYDQQEGMIQGFFRTELISLVISGAGSASLGVATMCNGASLAVKRSTYNRYTNQLRTDIYSGDDIFMLHALKKDNRRVNSVIKNKAGIVRTRPPENTIEFFNQRIRWVSKGTKYTDPVTMSLAILVLLTNLAILTSAIFCFMDIIRWWTLIFLFVLKIMADHLIITAGLKYFGKNKILIYLPLYEIVYPIYILIATLLGILNLYSWKGRSGRNITSI